MIPAAGATNSAHLLAVLVDCDLSDQNWLFHPYAGLLIHPASPPSSSECVWRLSQRSSQVPLPAVRATKSAEKGHPSSSNEAPAELPHHTSKLRQD